MSGAGIAVLVVVGLLVVGGIAYVQYLVAKKRREAFAAFAAQHGWTWTDRDDRWTDTFDGAPFGRGRDRRAENVLTGPYDGRPMVAFDYRYSTTRTTTVNGKTQTRTEVHRFSVVALDVGATLPDLDIEPEGMFDRMVDAVTGGDIDFESEDFNRMFRVRCSDRKFASDVVHPRMMETLMRHPGLACRFAGRHLLATGSGKHTEGQVLAMLGLLDEVVDQVPDFVWRDRTGGVPPAQPGQQQPQAPPQTPGPPA